MSACGVPECNVAAVYTTENGPRCYGHRDVEDPNEEKTTDE